MAKNYGEFAGFTDITYFQDSERAVTREEGLAFAKEHNCLFLECSARTRENVQLCFKDLTLKVLLEGSLSPLLFMIFLIVVSCSHVYRCLVCQYTVER